MAAVRKEGAANMKRAVRALLVLLFAAVFLFSGWKLMGILNGYREGQVSYEALEQHVSMEEPPKETVGPQPERFEVEVEEEEELPEPDTTQWPQIDFPALAQINPDIVGWIYIEGTDINYPVVQGTDNEYYLNHLFDGSENRSGCIFLDHRCSSDFSHGHSIIYGHHMKDQKMFSGLMDYKEQTFYDAHPTVLLLTPTENYRIQLFSGYVADNWSNAWELDLDDTNMAQWLQELQGRSCFTPTDIPEPTAQIVTLSTCTYEFQDAKFLVHGYIVASVPVSKNN